MPEWVLRFVIQRNIPKSQPNSYTVLISALKRVQSWGRAFTLFDEMEEQCQMKPDLVSYSAAISACEKGTRTDRALGLLQHALDRGLEPDLICFHASIGASGSGKNADRAVELLEELFWFKG